MHSEPRHTHTGLSSRAEEASGGVNWTLGSSDRVSTQTQGFSCGLRCSSLQEMTQAEQADSFLLVVHVGGEECESDYCIPPASLIWATAECRFAACQASSSRPTWQRRCVVLPHASMEVKACLVFRNSRLMCRWQKVLFTTLICLLVAIFTPQWLGEKISRALTHVPIFHLVPIGLHSHTLLILRRNDCWQRKQSRLHIVCSVQNMKRKSSSVLITHLKHKSQQTAAANTG